jgi:hypothetical protein
VHADERLTAFVELERRVRHCVRGREFENSDAVIETHEHATDACQWQSAGFASLWHRQTTKSLTRDVASFHMRYLPALDRSW